MREARRAARHLVHGASMPAKLALLLIRAFPTENCHRDVVGTIQISFHLLLQVVERIKLQIIVEAFLVVAMTSFYFSVVPRCPRPDQLVRNVVFIAEYIQRMNTVCFG